MFVIVQYNKAGKSTGVFACTGWDDEHRAQRMAEQMTEEAEGDYSYRVGRVIFGEVR